MVIPDLIAVLSSLSPQRCCTFPSSPTSLPLPCDLHLQVHVKWNILCVLQLDSSYTSCVFLLYAFLWHCILLNIPTDSEPLLSAALMTGCLMAVSSRSWISLDHDLLTEWNVGNCTLNTGVWVFLKGHSSLVITLNYWPIPSSAL